MKSISVQYQELKEGRITQHQFLRNARMLFPNFVTNHNSFDDSVKILKSKGLLNEGNAVKGTPDKAPSYDYPTQPGKYMKVVQEPEVDEQDGIYPATTVTDIPKEEVSKPIKSKNRPDGLEPAKDKDKKNEMKKIRIVKESKKNIAENLNELSPQTMYNAMRKADAIKRDQDEKSKSDPDNYSQSKRDDALDKSLKFEKHISPTTRKRVEDFAKKLNLKVEIKKTSIADDNYKPKIILSFLPYSGQGELVKVHITKTSDTIEGVLPGGEESRKALKNIINQIKKEELNVTLTETSVTAKQIQDKYNEMFGRNPQTTFADVAKALGISESEIAIALFSPDLSKNLREDDGDDAAFDAMIKKAMEEEEAEKAIKSGFGIYDPSDEGGKKKISKSELEDLWKAWEKRGEKPFAGVLPVGSQIDIKRNRLKETIKKMVNKVLDEYEKGDESDEAPSNREAVSEIVEMMIDKLEDTKSFKKSELEDVFSDFEDTVGKRYSDDVFNDVIDQLKRKGYNLK
jgi:hypothetical protein